MTHILKDKLVNAVHSRLRYHTSDIMILFILLKIIKITCCKEQYCIGTWDVMSMNQEKLEVVKQEMARVNILGINELRWTGMGEFNSDTVGRNPLEEMEYPS